ncbi:MAG: glucokinase [Gammaproteobacteria bacterium]|nr:glucokinase [Gammaproteobacteria bacterium]
MKSESEHRLIADIGGTNARFALLSSTGQISRQHTLACADYPDFVHAVTRYLQLADHPRIEEAAIAIANPIDGDKVKMTNHHWTFSIEQTRQTLNLKTLIFKNDLTALAMSIPDLDSKDLKQIGGEVIQKLLPLAVVAPGTGLGVSGLIKTGDRWIPLESEGGHVSLSPGNDHEIAILQYCRETYEHVSAERLISGMGIQNLYSAVCDIEGESPQKLSPVEISRLAIAGDDRICEIALNTFCGLLGSVTGNLVLTLGAFGGAFIGGGIVPSLGNYLDTSLFRARFEAKGRFRERLSRVPVHVIHAKNPVLSGIGKVFDLSQ